MQWRVIVVGGHTRSIGKTQLVCDLISAFPEKNWIAGKITQYGHGVCAQNGENCDCAPDEHVCAINWETQVDTGTDSARFLAAGAKRSFWLRTKQGFLAEIPQAQLVFRGGRSRQGRFQGFGSRRAGPRRCSSVAWLGGYFSSRRTCLDKASGTFAQGKTIRDATRGRAVARTASRARSANAGGASKCFDLTTLSYECRILTVDRPGEGGDNSVVPLLLEL